ncbi:MAG: RNA-splicing ligase RtcB [Chloroflexota bacterium]|nr:MAG: RNA-splicing ligase RtcB [Chloroflexota bacterium]
MNTHDLLTKAGYAGRPDYPQIARRAAALARQNLTAEKILATVTAEFSPVEPQLTLRDHPLNFAMYGTPGEDFEHGAVKQMRTAMSLPVAVSGAMLPDAHPGYALPIGGVVALDRAISPMFVGVDIACRMTLSILDLSPVEFMTHRDQLAADMRAISSFGMGASFSGKERRDHPVMIQPLWQELPTLRSLKDLAWQQLGSSGGGNHFFDAVIGEVMAEVEWLPLRQGQLFVAMMTHSGSRKTGATLAGHYAKLAIQETTRIARGIPKDYEWLGIDTDPGREYLAVMNLMGSYAEANHQLIHDLFLKRSGLNQIARYQNHHNYAWLRPDGTVIHRKGATPAGKGQVGIIPGSSGTPSYLVEGLGNPASLESSSHGAGRPFSRSEAKRRHDEQFFQDWMAEHGILFFGVAPDETLLAYKDIERVMGLQTDLVRPVAKMLPKVVIMGGKSDDGD